MLFLMDTILVIIMLVVFFIIDTQLLISSHFPYRSIYDN